ncbi:MAG: PhzA/PhzB family protein [Gammaproteobacteria bacterium]|nr:PhzA/PhzB family protein [Gammaproteobacteria bacterium]
MAGMNRRELIQLMSLAPVAGGVGVLDVASAAEGGINQDIKVRAKAGVQRPIMPPWSVIEAFPLFADHRELRIRNRTTVEKYLSMAGQERIDRWQLYAEDCKNMIDGFYQPPASDPRVPQESAAGGLENQKKMEKMNADGFPDWKFYNNIIYETEDPNVIVVEGDGSGLSYLRDPDHPNRHSDHYFHFFRLVEGRIRNYTEVRNETQELREWGINPVMPVIRPLEAMYESVAQEDAPYRCDLRNDPLLRQRNLAAVQQYFSYSGRSHAGRWQLFTEDGSTGPGYTADGRILRATGIDKVKAAEGIRAESFPDWTYSQLKIHQTTDPNVFAVDVMGKGVCVDYAAKPFDYMEHFYYSFRMRDGRIKDLREYADPKRIPALMGWDLKLQGGGPAGPGPGSSGPGPVPAAPR